MAIAYDVESVEEGLRMAMAKSGDKVFCIDILYGTDSNGAKRMSLVVVTCSTPNLSKPGKSWFTPPFALLVPLANLQPSPFSLPTCFLEFASNSWVSIVTNDYKPVGETPVWRELQEGCKRLGLVGLDQPSERHFPMYATTGVEFDRISDVMYPPGFERPSSFQGTDSMVSQKGIIIP